MRSTSLGDDLPPQERVRLPEVVRDTVGDLETTVRHELGQLLQRHDGRMSSAAARNVMGTGESANCRNSCGSWIHSMNDS